MLDLKIINAMIVDGSGKNRFAGAIGIRNGRISAVGEVTEEARETIDAHGQIASPGFIDAHTHYDAQVFWDPHLTPSCFHGVTTVVGGFCGFSIAPMTADAATYIKPMLARVEGIPLETLDQAVPWTSWQSFGQFLDRLEGRVGLNVGFFCGHSALRRIVMGDRAVGKKATGYELAHMKRLLAQSLDQGAMGFSTTISPSHLDGDGNAVPSRWADYSELLALASVVRDFEGTGLEILPDLDFPPEVVELMADFSLAGQRPVNWNALAVTGHDMKAAARRAEKMLGVSDYARERGGEVIALTIPGPPNVYLNLNDGIGFSSLPGLWRNIFLLPVTDRIERFRDPDIRRQLSADAASVPWDSGLAFTASFSDYFVATVSSPANRNHVGRPVRDIMAETGRDAIDVLLDIAIEDELRTTFLPDTGGEDADAYALRARLWRDDRTLIGASDAGAHIDIIDTFAFSSTLLQRGVRDHAVISLEEAVNLITHRIARYFGLIDRGLIAPGHHADIVIFDEQYIGRGPTILRADLPGGASRLYAEATGIPQVFVNGVQIIRDGELTEALPGKVLRSGKDTHTVHIGELRRADITWARV